MLERIGCGVWLALFVGLPFFGMVTSIKRGSGILWGLSIGVAAWFALMSGYMTVLSILDLRRRHPIPPEKDVPRWVIPLIWCVCLVSITVCLILLKKF